MTSSTKPEVHYESQRHRRGPIESRPWVPCIKMSWTSAVWFLEYACDRQRDRQTNKQTNRYTDHWGSRSFRCVRGRKKTAGELYIQSFLNIYSVATIFLPCSTSSTSVVNKTHELIVATCTTLRRRDRRKLCLCRSAYVVMQMRWYNQWRLWVDRDNPFASAAAAARNCGWHAYEHIIIGLHSEFVHSYWTLRSLSRYIDF